MFILFTQSLFSVLSNEFGVLNNNQENDFSFRENIDDNNNNNNNDNYNDTYSNDNYNNNNNNNNNYKLSNAEWLDSVELLNLESVKKSPMQKHGNSTTVLDPESVKKGQAKKDGNSSPISPLSQALSPTLRSHPKM